MANEMAYGAEMAMKKKKWNNGMKSNQRES
jgi:hypothetical protein